VCAFVGLQKQNFESVVFLLRALHNLVDDSLETKLKPNLLGLLLPVPGAYHTIMQYFNTKFPKYIA